MAKISVVIPVYNEKACILKTLERVAAADFLGLDKEIVIVDDGSTDGTRQVLAPLRDKFKIILHSANYGKGAALKTGFKNCQGEIIAIQDADLEYNPTDLTHLIEPIINNQATVVYGSRMISQNPIGHYHYFLGNKLIAWLTRWLYGCRLTDVETGYKVFRRTVLDRIHLEQDDFGFEVEFTAKILKNKISILELPISYRPRQFIDGKKIRWSDGFKALYLLVKYYFK